MKKVLLSLALAVSIIIGGVVSASAAPASLESDCSSKNTDIMYVKKPEKLYDTTSESTYTLSATAKEGTQITVYKKSVVDGKYQQIYYNENKADNTVTVGASGLYSIVVNLTEGTNNFLLYAEDAVLEVQIVKVDITKTEVKLIDKINKLSLKSGHQELSPLA